MRHEVTININSMDEGNGTVECEALDIDLEDLEEVLASAELDVSVDNDGIGSYEYWGFRGFDHGDNYAEVYGREEIAVHVAIENFDPEALGGLELAEWVEEVIRGAVQCERYIDLCPHSEYEEAYASAEARFNKVAEEVASGQAKVSFEVEWESDGKIREL
jgi:hypothetical protein